MIWNTEKDTISPPKFKLDLNANTKRSVLSSIASNFDIFNIGGPILNRARIFVHELQCNSKLNWDTKLDKESLKMWRNIANQVNVTPELHIDRFVGDRNHEYRIIAYTDTSKQLYGATLYIHDVTSDKLTFLFAKNRMISGNLRQKSIAALELLAVNFGVELLQKVKSELSGLKTMHPINITKMKLFTDSSITLDWLRSYNETFQKMNKKVVFVKNRLHSIAKLCENSPIDFSFISSKENPADYISRPFSYKILSKSCYWSGPPLPIEVDECNCLTIPNPQLGSHSELDVMTSNLNSVQPMVEQLVDPASHSSFKKVLNIHVNILMFISKVKTKIKMRGETFSDYIVPSREDVVKQAYQIIVQRDQLLHYSSVFSYMNNNKRNVRDAPSIMTQLNVFKDKNEILRVKCKLSHVGKHMIDFPILLAKNSRITTLLIEDFHRTLRHAGKYSVLSEFRKKFYVPSSFSTVRKILQNCVYCRKFNNRTIKINQNSYRKFRTDPSVIPFRNIFIDYLGPFLITLSGVSCKVYILLFSCLFSRAINLQICLDLSLPNFLRSFQLHVFKHGLPSLCLSDLGTQIVAGANVVSQHLLDNETVSFLNENGIKTVEFSQYPKGRNELGGLVEILVKLVKRLLYASVGKSILSYSDLPGLRNEPLGQSPTNQLQRGSERFRHGRGNTCSHYP